MLTFTLERHQGLIDAINGHRSKLHAAAAAQPMVFGVDLSHWQGPIDFAKVKAAGFTFVVIKATEGTGYVDPSFRAYRAQAHAAGLIVRMYHYAGSSSARQVFDVAAEAAWFAKTVSPLAVGEGADLDWEPSVPPANPTVWARAWLDQTTGLGASPWIYMNSSTEARFDWTGAGIPPLYGLWLAKYDNNPAMDPVVHWPALAAEQYWDWATVPGIAGPVDVDVFYGTTSQLLAYCKSGTPTPTPPEDDMSAQAEQQIADIHGWLQGAKNDQNPDGHDNVYQLWEMLKGQNPPGLNNFHWTVTTLSAQIAGLQSALAALAASPGGLTAEQITAAAQAGADKALAELVNRIKTNSGPAQAS